MADGGGFGGPSLNPVLRTFWEARSIEGQGSIRNRVLYGGRASSKSWDAAGFAIFLASQFKVKVLCVRQFQNKIAESVYTLLKIQIDRFGLGDEFDIARDSIKHKRTGSEFIFYGLWRHIDEIKSTEGVDICWIEEAHNLTKVQWDILEPTLRSDNSQFWIIFNPRLATDFVYKRFVVNTPPRTIKRQINYTENPFLSQTMLDVIKSKHEEDVEEYNHIYLGEPREDDDAVIIKRSWIMAAIDARKKLGLPISNAKHRIGFDVADKGADLCAMVETQGVETVFVDEWKGGEHEILKSTRRVYARSLIHEADIDYDSVGVGVFVGGYVEEMNVEAQSRGQLSEIAYFPFNAGAGVINPDDKVDPNDPRSNAPTNHDHYSNLKAQAWFEIAKRFQNTFNAVERGLSFEPDEVISISSECDHLDKLVDELSTPRRDFDKAGKVMVESKKALAKREVPSPNIADAFVMANGPREMGVQAMMFLRKRRAA